MFRRAPVPCRPNAISELLPPELAIVDTTPCGRQAFHALSTLTKRLL